MSHPHGAYSTTHCASEEEAKWFAENLRQQGVANVVVDGTKVHIVREDAETPPVQKF